MARQVLSTDRQNPPKMIAPVDMHPLVVSPNSWMWNLRNQMKGEAKPTGGVSNLKASLNASHRTVRSKSRFENAPVLPGRQPSQLAHNGGRACKHERTRKVSPHARGT